ncbi:hypothetical protein BBP00_00005495 [Phytophthora kernoviae]|uniref:NADH:flavin oxidoreductase/NADH oxidase N-terminal domain-containing protein n=1 Tax=Phytophthora kernoviae TaxID=325452 RepID=A0A3F2RNQ4_9STRA|nr:hypothetical protein BBP00_00005495 [Phytophthora kernoviae]
MISTTPKLFSALTLGGKKGPVQLQHRVVMAPLTRLRTGEQGVPTDLVAEYYAQRATPGGLLIAEATNISPSARGYFGAPGLFTTEQVEGWKKVTRAVHAKGGKIFVQLWHTGRVSHPLNQPGGILPVSSSAVGLDDVRTSSVTREGRAKYVTPRALETHEIPGIVADYKRAAENAIAAGFDGVELHGANGYLLEQFLCDGVNRRTDSYGGSVENRARLMLEALNAVLSSLDSSQVAIRLSPFGVTFGCTDSTPKNTYGYVINQLNALNLAYLHIVEPRGYHFRGPLVPENGTTPFCRSLYKGVLMTSSGFDRATGVEITKNGLADCVAYGRPFISNPDFVHRLKTDAPWNDWDRKTYYVPANGPLSLGYTDYPTLDMKASLCTHFSDHNGILMLNLVPPQWRDPMQWGFFCAASFVRGISCFMRYAGVFCVFFGMTLIFVIGGVFMHAIIPIMADTTLQASLQKELFY